MSDIDLEAAAARMFGSTATPSRAPAPASRAPAPAPDADLQATAEKLFGTPDKAPAAPARRDDQVDSDQAVAARLHDADVERAHPDAYREIQRSAMEDHFSTPEEARQVAADWAGTIAAFGVNSSESAMLAQIGASALARPPTPELVSSWTEQSRDVLLQEAGGPERASQLLADVQIMVQRFGTPELRDVLEATGLGNHPQVVRAALIRAKALRAQGKL